MTIIRFNNWNVLLLAFYFRRIRIRYDVREFRSQ